ncbi:hypothetical protein JCM10207_000982 [Rhodosporidiobolus poonsookiae]
MSYRPSMLPGASLSSASTSSPAQARRLLDKQREFAAFSTVCSQAEQLAAFLDHFADKYDVLDGGSEAVGDVVEHWQNVFRVTGLALASLATQRTALAPTLAGEDKAPVNPEDVVLPPGSLPDKYVRIPVQQQEEVLEQAGEEAAAQ